MIKNVRQGDPLRNKTNESGKELDQGELPRSTEEHEYSGKDLDQGAQQGALRSATEENLNQTRRTAKERN